jgi:hypothetical protein
VAPFISKCLEFPEERLLNSTLKSLGAVANSIDMQFLSGNISPRVMAIISSNALVRRSALIALRDMVDLVDRKHLEETIFAGLENLQVPDIILVAEEYVNIVDIVGKKFPVTFRTRRLLSKLTTLLAEEGLTVEAFDKLIALVKTLVKDIEELRRKEFGTRQVRSNEVRSILSSAGTPKTLSVKNTDAVLDLDSLFSRHEDKKPPYSSTTDIFLLTSPTVSNLSSKSKPADDPFADLLGNFK